MTDENIIDNQLFAKAVSYASQKHDCQFRKDNTPYIYHPITVANMVKKAGYSIKYQIVAILHDTLEDTDATENDILEFGEDILKSVKLLTRKHGADEEEYVNNILNDHIAAVVKNADKINNLWESTLLVNKQFGQKYIKKAEKYYKGKFSYALDQAIASVDVELCYNIVRDHDMPYYSAADMLLYVDKEKQRKKVLFELSQACVHPDFSHPNIQFLWNDEDDEYFCVYDSPGEFENENTWKLTQAGWIPTPINIKTNYEYGLDKLSRKEILEIIKDKKDKDFFYNFTEEKFL